MKRTMKSLLCALLLLCVMILYLCASAAAEESYSPDGSVLFKKDGVKVTTAGLDKDPTTEDDEAIIWLEIENSGDKEISLGVSEGSVNGFMRDAYLIDYYVEDGEYCGGNYDFQITLPAGGTKRCALGCSHGGLDIGALHVMEFRFTLAEDEYSWPYYSSDPVKITTGEEVKPIDIGTLGTTVIDDDTMKLVVGDLAYDDWMGPMVWVYTENKTERYLYVTVDSAEADGKTCDYILYGAELAPGKCSDSFISFDSPIHEMKSFENLKLGFTVREADSKDTLDMMLDGTALAPVTVQFPPQNWGEYENGGLRLEIKPKYNDLVTVEIPENDPNGMLFEVSETASLAVGKYPGSGWLFSIGAVSEERAHEMLCHDMSGACIIAKKADGGYYVLYHPTDVRYERATVEEMQRDQDQWIMLCEWVGEVPDKFIELNGLEPVTFGNTDVDICLARALWADGVKATLSTTEFGPVDASAVDGTPYVEFVMQGWFEWVDLSETPDGEYVVLNLPEEDTRVDFFFAPGGYVRTVHGDYEALHQSMWYDETLSFADAMRGWYYAAAEKAGVKEPDAFMTAVTGDWSEKIAGRGRLTISRDLAPDQVKIEASWPESASVQDTWEMTAKKTEDGRLVYENGHFSSTEYDNGESWVTDEDWAVNGELVLDGDVLNWHDSRLGHEDNEFVRAS